MDIMGIAPGVWFPVVSVVAGFACKGILDHLTDRRRQTADSIARREGRSEAARLRRIEFQRNTLIELQGLLEESGRYAARAHVEDLVAYRESSVWGQNKRSDGLSEDMRQAQSRAMLLGSRVADEQIRLDSSKFRNGVSAVSLAHSEHESEASLNALVDLARSLHERIGMGLRRLDVDEESIFT